MHYGVWVQFPYVFLDGEIVELEAARLSVHANSLSYGVGTFEGIRAFKCVRGGLTMLAPKAHFERMHRSANILGIPLRYSVAELVRACEQLLQENGVADDAYLRPLLILSEESLQVRTHGHRSRMSIAITPIGLNYIDPKGVRCMVSTWRRNPDCALPNRAKPTGGYIGPAIAKSEALLRGFDEAIMLSTAGHVAEASTSNIFLRFGRTWVTPSLQDDILEGITRAELMVLIDEVLHENVLERSIDRSELYTADEILLCGTAAVVVPVTDVDGRPVGGGVPGERTMQLQRLLIAIARREDPRHEHWTTPVQL